MFEPIADDTEGFKDFISKYWMMVQILWSEDHIFYALLPKNPFFHDDEDIRPVHGSVIQYKERSCACIIIAISKSRDQLVEKFDDIKRWYRERVMIEARQSNVSQEYRRIMDESGHPMKAIVDANENSTSFSKEQIKYLTTVHKELKEKDSSEEALITRLASTTNELLSILDNKKDMHLMDSEDSDAVDDANEILLTRAGEQQLPQVEQPNVIELKPVPVNEPLRAPLSLDLQGENTPGSQRQPITLACGRPLEEVEGDTIVFGTHRTRVNLAQYARLEWDKPLKAARALLKIMFQYDVFSSYTLDDRDRKVSGVGRCNPDQLDEQMMSDFFQLMDKKCGVTKTMVRAAFAQEYEAQVRSEWTQNQMNQELYGGTGTPFYTNESLKWVLSPPLSNDGDLPLAKRICTVARPPLTLPLAAPLAFSPPPVVAQPLRDMEYALDLSITKVAETNMQPSNAPAYNCYEQETPLDFSVKSEYHA